MDFCSGKIHWHRYTFLFTLEKVQKEQKLSKPIFPMRNRVCPVTWSGKNLRWNFLESKNRQFSQEKRSGMILKSLFPEMISLSHSRPNPRMSFWIRRRWFIFCIATLRRTKRNRNRLFQQNNRLQNRIRKNKFCTVLQFAEQIATAKKNSYFLYKSLFFTCK